MALCPQSLWCRRLSLVLACAPFASCGSLVDTFANDERPVPNDVENVPLLREAVVPALLSFIDETTGLIRFPTPNVASDEMPLDTARAQAGEYLFYALNVFFIRASVAGSRGAFIDLPTLVPCSRPQLVRAVYERPPDTLAAAIRLQLGSYWTIPFCGTRRTPEVVVSVATLGNNVRYKNSRPVGDTASQGAAFRVAGIPWEWKVEHVVTAEEAVNEAYAVTGLRAMRLPELVSGNQVNGRPSGSVRCPLWRVSLERPIRMAAVFSLRRLDLSEVYVGTTDCSGLLGGALVLTPMPEQPVSREFVVVLRDTTEVSGFRRVVYEARYRAPVNFESVIIEK